MAAAMMDDFPPTPDRLVTRQIVPDRPQQERARGVRGVRRGFDAIAEYFL